MFKDQSSIQTSQSKYKSHYLVID